MPGLDLYKSLNGSAAEAMIREIRPRATPMYEPIVEEPEREEVLHNPDIYYNARLDPKNYLDGPLSWNPSTRLRQMLARPGIVVRR
jgi:hypothetical protein